MTKTARLHDETCCRSFAARGGGGAPGDAPGTPIGLKLAISEVVCADSSGAPTVEGLY